MKGEEDLKQKKKGLTLIELVIVIAISGIVISSLSSIYVSNMKSFKKSNERSQNQYDVKMAADFITEQLRYAKNVKITNTVPAADESSNNIYLSISGDNSQIAYNKKGIAASTPGISNVNDYTLEFTKVSDDVIKFKVGKKGTNAYDIETQVKVLNIAETSPYIIQGTSGSNVTYIIDEKVSDSEAVDLDLSWVKIENASNITENIILPSLGPNGCTLTWSSSNTSVVADNGSVTRQESDVTVNLTATVSKSGITKAKVISITVIRKGADPAILSISDISDSIILNGVYTMPSTLVATLSDGSTKNVSVSWNPSFIDTTSTGMKTCKGTVEGYDKEVTLTVKVYQVEGPEINTIEKNKENEINLEMNKGIKSVSIEVVSVNKKDTTVTATVDNDNPKKVKITFSNVKNKDSYKVTFIGNDNSDSAYLITFYNKNSSTWTFEKQTD